MARFTPNSPILRRSLQQHQISMIIVLFWLQHVYGELRSVKDGSFRQLQTFKTIALELPCIRDQGFEVCSFGPRKNLIAHEVFLMVTAENPAEPEVCFIDSRLPSWPPRKAAGATGCNLMILAEKLHCPRSRPFEQALTWDLFRGDGNLASTKT